MENGQHDSQNPISTNNSNNTKKRYNKYLPFLLAGIVAVGLVACKFLQKESVPAMAEAVIATETEEPDEEATEQEDGQEEPDESDSVADVSDIELDDQSKDNLTTSEPEDNLITSEPEDLNKEDNLSQVEEQSESDEIINNMEGTEQTSTPTQSNSPSNQNPDTPTTPTEIEAELEAELESIIESTNPADITDTPVQIEGETQQGNGSTGTSSLPQGTEGTAGTGSQTQGSTGQTQAPSGTQGTPSQDTEVKQPNEQTQQNVSGSGSGTGSTGGAPVNIGDPGYDPNYVSHITGVVLDRNHNGIPDPLEIGKPGKVETVEAIGDYH